MMCRPVETIGLLALVALVACSGGDGSSGGDKCSSSNECTRGTVCVDKKCKSYPCTGHAQCIQEVQDGTFCWAEAGVCTAVECSQGFPCTDGLECQDFLCQEVEPECMNNAGCKQPAEKCLNGKCVDRDFCEKDDDCTNGYCLLDQDTCQYYQPDTWADTTETTEPECELPNPLPEPDEFLCLACDPEDECACAPGVCVTGDAGTFCSLECEDNSVCPAGYKCKEQLCSPLGVGCSGCVLPDSACEAGMTCDFSTGSCAPQKPVCAPCNLDYECGAGYRCFTYDGVTSVCMPECELPNYKCPISSGCQEREDGVYVCVHQGKECCYGKDCDTCGCQAPTPYCKYHEDGITYDCVQCLVNSNCPLNLPYCNQENNECELFCQDPTPVYWFDEESGQPLCVQCLNSAKDCPPGQYCGMDDKDPEKYHKCYELQ